MIRLPGWLSRPPILMSETPKGPWGGGGDQEPGPRNPWSVPPSSKTGSPKPTALDEFLARARRGVGGGPGGMPPLPTGNARTLWALGVAVLVLVWIVVTSVHQIGPQQQGIVSYFGRYSQTLSPGFFQHMQVTAKSFICPFLTPPTAPWRVAAVGTYRRGKKLLLTVAPLSKCTVAPWHAKGPGRLFFTSISSSVSDCLAQPAACCTFCCSLAERATSS